MFAVNYHLHAIPLRLADTYWQGFFGNWLATSVGIVTGLPIAIGINSIADRMARRRDAAVAIEELGRTRLRLVALARSELNTIRDSSSQVAQGHVEYLAAPMNGLQAIVSLPTLAETLRVDSIVQLARVVHALDTLKRLTFAWLTERLSAPISQPPTQTSATQEIIIATATDVFTLANAALAELQRESI